MDYLTLKFLFLESCYIFTLEPLLVVIMDRFPGGSVVKNLPANAGDAGSIPGSENPLEKKMQLILAYLPGESPTEEPGRL